MPRMTVRVLAFACMLAACTAPPSPVTPPSAAPPTAAWDAVALADLRMIAALTPAEGLPPETAAVTKLETLATDTDARAASERDRTADALFARLAERFAQGGADPAVADPAWRIARAGAPDLAALRVALAAGASPSTQLRALLPDEPEYDALRRELARVTAEPAGTPDANGLTREARIDRLRVNLERWRWLPRHLPARRIDVRVPRFELLVRREGAAPERHAVIVGARDMPTPSFAADIGAVTLNPTWTPPSKIVREELLPRFRRDPDAAAREGFDVLDAGGNIVPPGAVDWQARPFPYTLRQRPGPANALGRVRFDLPNPFAIYLHDTPSRGVFAQADRARSHGCIRVADPVGMAESLFDMPSWRRDAIERAIDAGDTQRVPLAASTPVYILYLTAVVDETGAVAYANDIYRRDARVLRALDADPSIPRASATGLAATGCGV
jgi:L,D-transpeptidase YcbB